MMQFSVIPGTAVRQIIDEQPKRFITLVADAYLQHYAGASVNPDSYFLRFPHVPANRIIALPAALLGERPVSGIKWIASYPGNTRLNLPRASAVLILNSADTGYPIACIEASLISAVRTAASAVLAAFWLNGKQRQTGSVGIVGAGVIARNIIDMFIADDWQAKSVVVHDIDGVAAQALAAHVARSSLAVVTTQTLDEALRCDVVVFATTAAVPYVAPPRQFRPDQIILNVSLRDLAPELILQGANIVDDIDHCLKASTSPHLAEQLVGNRDFIDGTLAELMIGKVTLRSGKPLIFSPFGMGILDLAVGLDIFEQANARQLHQVVPGFFAETTRWLDPT